MGIQVMKYVCPFCYKKMPDSYEPSGWSCCGEVGHATILPECPKCGAENMDLPLRGCEVCGFGATPRTDEFDSQTGEIHASEAIDLWRDFAGQLERELNHASEAVKVALERAMNDDAEIADLRAQLPDRMKDCTIVFKECKWGHGWLTATNWVQHPCPTCSLAEVTAQFAAAERAIEGHKNALALVAEQARMANGSAEAAERDRAKLVEALKAIDASYKAHAELWPDDVPTRSVRDAIALLRELGESA